jgi:hypothetical protein
LLTFPPDKRLTPFCRDEVAVFSKDINMAQVAAAEEANFGHRFSQKEGGRVV